MSISQILKFEGSLDDLIWKHPIENFNTTSQLIVDETHEALLVVNGNACDLFGPGRHTLETPNIPLVKKIINIPTDGQTPFPCKVFFFNKVHQMDMRWGIPGEITLDDPKYDIFLHIGLCGNMNFVISDSRKFILKAVGFREDFDGNELVNKFRGIIKQYVKSYIAKIMNVGKVSYFDMNENLFEVSNVVKEQLIPIFADYGIEVLVFNIESITVPDEDYEAVRRAKERRASRKLEGYTWQEEKQMEVAKEFAGNDGTLGGIGGAVGGFLAGGAFGGSIADIARNALGGQMPSGNGTSAGTGQESNLGGTSMGMPGTNPGQGFDVNGFLSNMGQPVNTNNQNMVSNNAEFNNQPVNDFMSNNQVTDNTMSENNVSQVQGKFCVQCGNSLTSDMMFCPKCGTRQGKVCPNCNTSLSADSMFCHKCGTKCD